MNVTTIVLINGLWMTALSWEHWVRHYTDKGYCVIAANWPGMEGDIEQLRRDPSSFAITWIDRRCRSLRTNHSRTRNSAAHHRIWLRRFGDADSSRSRLGRCRCGDRQCSGKGNCPVAVVGIEAGVLSSRQVSQQQNRFTDSGTISSRVCKLADGNRIARRLQTLRRAGSESGSVANSVRKFHFAQLQPPSTFGTTRARRLLLVAGGKDRVVPSSIVKANFDLYRESKAETDYKEFPDQTHFTLLQETQSRGLRARLGALPRQRVKADRRSQSDRRLVGSTLNLTKRRSNMPTTTTAPTATKTTASPATAKSRQAAKTTARAQQ